MIASIDPIYTDTYTEYWGDIMSFDRVRFDNDDRDPERFEKWRKRNKKMDRIRNNREFRYRGK